jgi:hypothetical protein
VGDAEIYLPGIKQRYDPHLYPFNAQFFSAHSHLSLFAGLIGESARLLHLSVDVAIFLWQMVGVFAMVVAGWRVASLCFAGTAARWGAVALLTATLATPVAGTAIPIMDPYLDSRSLSTPMILLAIESYFGGRKKSAAAWLAATALIHPQMAVFGVGFVLLTEVESWLARLRRLTVTDGKRSVILRFVQDQSSQRSHCAALAPGTPEPHAKHPGFFEWITAPLPALLASLLVLLVMVSVPLALPKSFPLGVAQGAYRDVLYSRPFFFVFEWRWWEWVGVFCPLAILYGLGRRPPHGALPPMRAITSALMPFAGVSLAYAMLLDSTHRLDYWVRLQPMRSFQLVYIFLFLFLGGALGEWLLKDRAWRWIALFLPMGTGMYLWARVDYPQSRQVEWPTGSAEANPWLEAFFWVRGNTPTDAMFALDPQYVGRDDTHGFRAIAERSALADSLKDSGAASVFPGLASEWRRQQEAQSGWREFGVEDFERLRREYGVDWVVVEHPPVGLMCPYQNATVAVCRVGVAFQANAHHLSHSR